MTKSTPITVGIHEAKTRLSELLRLIDGGVEAVIARGREPIAKLVPFRAREVRQLGIDRGSYTVPDDFDAPLPADVLEDLYR